MTISRTLITAMAAFTLVACAAETTQSKPEAQSSEAHAPRGERSNGNRPERAGITEAAEKLGVTPDALQQAIRESGRPPNFEKAAETLGVSVDDLRAALPARGDRPRGDGQRGERPQGDRPKGDRQRGDRQKGDRPRGDRPRGERPRRQQ